jgi:hypothetical protein
MDCSTCEKKTAVAEPVPYIVHESAMARNERTNKHLIIVLVIVIFLWFITIGCGLWYFNQFDFVTNEETREYHQDGEGVNIIGSENGVDFNESDVEGDADNANP